MLWFPQLSKITPSDEAVIGFVTSGNFSLSRGKGYALGAISLAKFLDIQEQAHRQASSIFPCAR
jgi:ribonuclease P/MRP protein subunit POP1